jgi:hypothetical protein
MCALLLYLHNNVLSSVLLVPTQQLYVPLAALHSCHGVELSPEQRPVTQLLYCYCLKATAECHEVCIRMQVDQRCTAMLCAATSAVE